MAQQVEDEMNGVEDELHDQTLEDRVTKQGAGV
jgi:hypothetical protein